MAANDKLNRAIKLKNDEFYTQYADIEKEIQSYLDFNPQLFFGKTILCPCDNPMLSNFTKYFVENFNRLGLKKLISCCYLKDEKGILLIKTIDNTSMSLLNENGDFRSSELIQFRNEADFIITNPPFSLFCEFINWIFNANIKFSIICNKNCITFKEVFPKIKNNEVWSGYRSWSGGMWFQTIDKNNIDKIQNGLELKNIPAIWLTNIEYNRNFKYIPLFSMKENLIKYPKLKDKDAYVQYDNYNAIEIPEVRAIPNDYHGIMGVPISFLDKFNPNQFKIIGMDIDVKSGILSELAIPDWTGKLDSGYVNGKRKYSRLLVQHLHK